MRHPRRPPRTPPSLPLPLLSLLLLLGLAPCALPPGGGRWPQGEEALSPLVEEAALRHGLPPSLVQAVVWKESRFRPKATGSQGEIGLMQLTPGAMRDWAAAHGCPPPGRGRAFAPALNLEIGCWYLARALRRWEGYHSALVLALAEYNAGPATVLREWRPATPDTPLPLEEIPYPETREYIRQILLQKEHYDTRPSAP